MNSPGFIPKFGGYQQLLSYQKARVVYKGTVYFIKRWVPRISRTTDQMQQAARSGKQNIVEGSLASAVSKETEVKLTGVALASLGELLEDYRDFLYVREFTEWPLAHPYVRHLSQLCRTPGVSPAVGGRGTATCCVPGKVADRCRDAREAALAPFVPLVLGVPTVHFSPFCDLCPPHFFYRHSLANMAY